MKKLCICGCSIKNSFLKIHLIDKCLIIIMFLLLLQSGFSLFSNYKVTPEINTIDTIVRTAIASIFGYFLSSNFIRHLRMERMEEGSSNNITIFESEKSHDRKGHDIKSSIGFSIPHTDESLESGKITVTPEPKSLQQSNTAGHLQIIVTASIAIFCLIVLIIFRNVSYFTGEFPATSSFLATISQFRDLISGCIGFLIGAPTSNK